MSKDQPEATLTFEATRRLRQLMRYADRITREYQDNKRSALHLDADGDDPRNLKLTASDGWRRILHATVAADRGNIADRHHYSMPNKLAKTIAKATSRQLEMELQSTAIVIRAAGAEPTDETFEDTDKVPEDIFSNAVARFRKESESPIWARTLDYRQTRTAAAKLRAIAQSDARANGHVTVFNRGPAIEFNGAARIRTRDAETDPEIKLVDLLQALDDVNRGQSAEIMLCETGYRLRVSVIGREHEIYLTATHRQ